MIMPEVKYPTRGWGGGCLTCHGMESTFQPGEGLSKETTPVCFSPQMGCMGYITKNNTTFTFDDYVHLRLRTHSFVHVLVELAANEIIPWMYY